MGIRDQLLDPPLVYDTSRASFSSFTCDMMFLLMLLEYCCSRFQNVSDRHQMVDSISVTRLVSCVLTYIVQCSEIVESTNTKENNALDSTLNKQTVQGGKGRYYCPIHSPHKRSWNILKFQECLFHFIVPQLARSRSASVLVLELP
jgi:hypothetical protein